VADGFGGCSMTATFRIANISDIDSLIELMREYYAFDRLPFDESHARAALQGILTDDSLGQLWLIHDDGQTVGYLVLTWGYSLEFMGRDAFLDELYIRASHRRRGVGSKALAFAEEICHSFGIRALHLEVERENHGAQTCYRKAGFEDHDRYLMTKLISR